MRALTFTGFRHSDGTLEVDPGFVIDVESLPEQDVADGDAIEVVALGRAGDPLATTRIPLVDPCAPPLAGGIEPAPTATGIIDFPPETVALRAAMDDRVLWTRRAPRRALAVEVQWPDAVKRDPVRVAWRSSTDGCLAALGWSADGGRTMSPLSLPTASPVIVADLSTVAGGPDCSFTLHVTDGWSSQQFTSDTFPLEPGGWQVWILAPANGSVIRAGDELLLAGQGYHLEEHRHGEDLEWSSSLTGGLGDGARRITTLTPGEHIITASLEGVSAQVQVSVREPD
jgi:hypothetical protein